jgi:hypothetical protein
MAQLWMTWCFFGDRATNYRLPPQSDTHLTPDLVLQLKQQLSQDLLAYVERASANHSAAYKAKWQLWLTAVYAGITQQIDAMPLNALIADLVPSLSEVPAPDITEEDLQQFLRALHKRLVITRVDKAGKSYAAMCPAMYVTELRSQMGSACFEVCPEPPEALIHQARSAVPMFFEHFRHQEGEPSLASANLLVKFHKTPAKCRMLACCHGYYYKQLGLVCTSIFRALGKDLVTLWQKELKAAGLHRVGGSMKPWFINSTDKALRVIQALSAQGLSYTEFTYAGGVASFDFAQMYTHVPHEDMLRRLSVFLLGPIWQQQYKHATTTPFQQALLTRNDLLPILVVFRNKRAKHIWLKDAAAAKRYQQQQGVTWLGTYGKNRWSGTFDMVHVKDVVQLLQCLISHSYIQCFGVAYRQRVGIPMGIAPGVYLADWYLASYELAHMQNLGGVLRAHPEPGGLSVQEAVSWGKLVAQRPGDMRSTHGALYDGCLAMFVWQSWALVMHYVDDLQVFCHLVVRGLLHTDQFLCGTAIRGVYPRHCPLEETPVTNLLQVPYLDILQEFRDFHGWLLVSTSIHDRRRGPAFQGLCLAVFPHASCAFAHTALNNMVRAGMQRRLRIPNNHLAQVWELATFASSLRGLGYPAQLIHNNMLFVVGRYPYLLAGASPAQVMHGVTWAPPPPPL